MKFSAISPDGIPFEKLDVEMKEIIKILNLDYGIKTKYCCFGHEDRAIMYIMFHEEMNDLIEELAFKISEHIAGKDFGFHCWIRKVKKVEKNWICKTNGAKSQIERYRILQKFIEVLKNSFRDRCKGVC
ncbi:hypothetical protein WGM54_14915 [Paenibacillus polymyxa]|uniref:hypothetical protein n=1 Tax=Paenibacillus polymyxa TaxID=1406 RepID=UPI00307E1851